MTLHVATLFMLTTGIGFLMILSGVGKRALDWTRRRRLCPSCGREIRGRRCACVG
jgi:hypothetical protein